MTKEKDYQAAADWAEHDMSLKPGSRTALRGEAAASHGSATLVRALGGRPSIDPNAKPGQHSRTRQVRLPNDHSARRLGFEARGGAPDRSTDSSPPVCG